MNGKNLEKVYRLCLKRERDRERKAHKMSDASYWEEYERAKAGALKMAAKLSAKERGTIVKSLRCGMIDDVRHDQTCQRLFECGFLSLDHPDENGDMWDYGDCGREMKRMLRAIDTPYLEMVREMRFCAALNSLEAHPELAKTLVAIRLHHRGGRKRIAAALGIFVDVYAKRFTRICQILTTLFA